MADPRQQQGRDGEQRDRILGGLLGVHCGDSLGATFERGSDPLTAGETHERSAANGGLMRCLPTALARRHDETRHRETVLISSVTHREARCLDAATAYNDIAHFLLEGEQPHRAIDRAVSRLAGYEHDGRARAVILEGRNRSTMPIQPGGYVLTSLEIAVWAVCQPRPAEEVLIEVGNAGGDADTNGAIAGGLLGVRDGVRAWPARWVDALQRAAELRRLAEDLRAVRQAA